MLRQAGVADRYQRLEELLLRLADVEAAENPDRAALLRQAAKQSREKFVLQQLRNASEALRNEKFSDAVNNQDSASVGLAEILKLLTSEDRANRIRDEKERLSKMIKDLKRIERSQRSTRARTENGAELDQLEKEQESIADRGQKLKDQLAEENGGEKESGDKESGDKESGDKEGEDKEGEDKEGEAKEGEAKEGEAKEGEAKEGEAKEGEAKEGEAKEGEAKEGEAKEGEAKEGEAKEGEAKEGEAKEGEAKEGEAKEGEAKEGEAKPGSEQQSQQGEQGQQGEQSQQPQSPQQQAEQKLQQAIEKMRQAEQDLEQSKRDEAVEDQLAAEENLRQAIDELEQILRQLREEEMQRELARLESRLKKMAAMQSKVIDDTAELAATPKSQRNRQTDLKAGDLSFDQKKITVEADRAMLLLREEGSSVAFPEVVAQIRDESERIAQRLGKTQIDAVTQGMQQDVLAAIEEMIGALQQAQRDLEKQKQQGQSAPQQAGQPGEQPLVGAISELKLIRTMETRIKSTTQRYAGLLQSDETSAQDVLPLLKNLSDRQARLYKITRDLVMQRNK
ncbi:putative sodium/potassium/calcium exchanger [Stieleria neptunia]|uniref:hypothetical protein n=1 Tax=Stieleria neptunia TaxID=2527979 RepID=UPI001E359E63|nr:hypothetical protein [Stieleria neptunia]